MDALLLLRLMLRIRFFEEKVEALFSAGRIPGTTHLSIGQEAVAAGACAALRERDCVMSTHRGHGHLLARGGDPGRLLAEIMGKGTGYCGGRGGTQHVSAMEVGFLGTNGITGGGIPVAAGAALAIRLRGEPRVVLSFFGEGAVAQGTFHETLNFAALHHLPIVFLCENNGYAMSLAVDRALADPDIAGKAAAYARGNEGLAGIRTDGMRVLEVFRAALQGVKRARAGDGPTLIEAVTYRYKGHSKSDPRAYRTREEEAEWAERDPIPAFRKELLVLGHAAADLDRIAAQERAAIEAAAEFAEKSPCA